MYQSRISSFVESLLNTLSGIILTYLVIRFLVPLIWDLPVAEDQVSQIVILLTLISVIRDYTWRRIFNSKKSRVEFISDTLKFIDLPPKP